MIQRKPYTQISAALWCFFIFLTPVFAHAGGVFSRFSELLYLFYSPVCHQLDAHSFHFLGGKFAVCIRCTAIYCSFFAGSLLSSVLPAPKNIRLFLMVIILPMLADVGLNMLEIVPSSTESRIITGTILGFGLAIALTENLQQTFHYFFSSLLQIKRYAFKAR